MMQYYRKHIKLRYPLSNFFAKQSVKKINNSDYILIYYLCKITRRNDTLYDKLQ